MERRQKLRVPLSATVQLEAEDYPSAGYQTANVSEGGMYIPTDSPHRVGTTVRFSIDLGKATICGTARVVWSRTASNPPALTGMGLEHVTFDDDGQQSLLAAIEEHLA